jgi:hypothetical protein
VSALSTTTLLLALLAPRQQQENERVGPAPGGGTAIAPLMRDGIGSVFALSSLTGGVGQGAILGGATGGELDLYGAGTAGALSGYGGMIGGAGPGGLAAMGGGSLAMPNALGAGMAGGKGGARGSIGFHSPSRRGLVPKGGLAAKGKGKAAPSKFGLLGARPSTATLDPLLKGLVTAGPISPEEAKLIVHAMVAADESGVKDPEARASLRDARRNFVAPAVSADATALQEKMDQLVPAPADAAARPIDDDMIRAWFGALDASNDGAISFLEWRDRTGLGLDAFRAFDTSGEGLIQFEELEHALVLNAISEGRPVDAALVDAIRPEGSAAAEAEERTADAKEKKKKRTEPPPQVPLDDLLKQVRSLLAKAAAQQSGLATKSGVPSATDAKGKTGGAGKGGAKAKPAPSPFDMLGTTPKPAPKKPAPKRPATAPVDSSSGNQ